MFEIVEKHPQQQNQLKHLKTPNQRFTQETPRNSDTHALFDTGSIALVSGELRNQKTGTDFGLAID